MSNSISLDEATKQFDNAKYLCLRYAYEKAEAYAQHHLNLFRKQIESGIKFTYTRSEGSVITEILNYEQPKHPTNLAQCDTLTADVKLIIKYNTKDNQTKVSSTLIKNIQRIYNIPDNIKYEF